MRLICPNCDAQYEVDDAAIPVAGRDVQCSSCGHAWFQQPPEVEAEQQAEAELYDAPEVPEPPPAPPVMPPVDATVIQPRPIDEAVLAVLREEADREMIARRLDAETALETQGDLGIDAATAAATSAQSAARHIALMKGEDPDAVIEPPRERTRREMLPDIEEINSSLRAGDVAIGEDGAAFEIARRPEPRSGFRSGFVLMLVLAMVVVALYVMAPRISAQFPAAQPALDSYVAAVDQGRVWLDATMKSIVASLKGLAGTDSAQQ
jgi:predicted Zn finger-like uncharacterized protein